MKLNSFLSAVETIAARNPVYKLGKSGTTKNESGRYWCDCIGLIIGACSICGFSWPGIHGSNWAARNAVTGFSKIPKASALAVGDLVFKAKEPGESGYALPDRYDSHPDRRDYYHVGVVTSTAPFVITHCTGPGIVRDTKLGKWSYYGKLKYINEGDEPVMPEGNAIVTAASGSTVNLRKSASTSAALVARIPIGASVSVLGESEGWSSVQYCGKTGYMKSDFLIAESQPEVAGTIEERLTALEERVARLEGGVG